MAGLQAAQELPGLLLHEELVPGSPAGHCLPGAGHLGGGKKVTIQAGAVCSQGTLEEVNLMGGVGDISMTLPLETSLLCSLQLPGGPGEVTPVSEYECWTTRHGQAPLWHQPPPEKKLYPHGLVRRRGSHMQVFT